jgi:hypothetical protein
MFFHFNVTIYNFYVTKFVTISILNLKAKAFDVYSEKNPEFLKSVFQFL